MQEETIGEIVANDYRTAAIFKSYKIDFCCNGNRKFSDVCKEKNIDMEKLADEINAVTLKQSSNTFDYKSMDTDLLIDYVEKKHHRYVNNTIPVLLQYLDKLCKVHGNQHQELFEINNEFKECATALTAHMKKEELILFPIIRNMMKANATHHELNLPHFKTVNNPINVMLSEHDTEGERFRKIALLSNDYTPPADACGTYKVAFSLLKEFEDDLHTHIHLENNIVFPRAIELQKQLDEMNSEIN
jgi:regulator of cell morphogenesis and NO signaling